MNKKLIAMAVAASMAAPLAAQAEVTVYGQLQVELQNIKLDDGVNNNSSAGDGHIVSTGNYVGEVTDTTNGNTALADNKRGRLGVKGSEDLGDGLKAIYKFEWQVNTSDGNPANGSTNGARESYVGLNGNWGTFMAGSLKSPYKYTGGVTYDALVTTASEARRYGGMSNGVFGQGGFFQNAVAYVTPKIGGFSAAIGYVPDNTSGLNGSNAWDIKYGGKNWEVFIAQANQLVSTSVDSNFTANKAGGKITFAKMWTILAQYEMTKQETTGGDDKGNVGFLALQAKLGKNMLVLQGGTGKVDFASATSEDQTDTYIGAGWIYRFTKKTRAFLTYRNTSVDNAAGVQDQTNNSSAYSAGLRIDF